MMTNSNGAAKVPASRARPARTARRWLLFVHQLPSTPSNLRVRTWRRLQQLGAIPVKQAVYALPDTPDAREDFEWLRSEVKAAGGDASVFAADNVDPWSDDSLVEDFRRSRQEAYSTLARDIESILKRAASTRRPSGGRAPALRRLLDVFRERQAGIERIDFFGSAGRDRVATLMTRLEEQALGRAAAASTASGGPDGAERHHARLWVTRPRPGVDRMASAWLIRRFVDPQAEFAFAADRDAVPDGSLPFDMFGVEFSHQGDGCTFETLCRVFALQGTALARIAAIVHDLDLKDNRFGAPEAATVGHVIDGLQFAHADDDTLLAQGMALFDSLYRSFEHAARADGPRPVASPKKRGSARGAPASKRGRRT
jgi:hypothetical protein